MDRNDTILALRRALRARSGRTWSVGRLRLRVELCPCGGGLCLHCVEDLKSVERAWEASAPTTSPSTPSA